MKTKPHAPSVGGLIHLFAAAAADVRHPTPALHPISEDSRARRLGGWLAGAGLAMLSVLNVAAQGDFGIGGPPALVEAYTGEYYAQEITVTNGVPPYTVTISFGSLPAGLSANGTASGAVISGTPLFSGSSTFDVRIRDLVNQTATRRYTLPVLPYRTCASLTNGVVAWWSGDSNTLDRVTTNHGTSQYGAGFGPGRSGGAFVLDGVDDFVAIPSTASLSVTGAITVEAWVWPAAGGASGSVVTKYNSALNRASWGLLLTGGGIEFYVNGTGDLTGAKWSDTATNLLPAGTWSHLAGTFDTANQQLRIYVNGQEAPSTNGHDAVITSLFDSPESVLIGSYVDSGGQVAGHFAGSVDEVLLHHRALTADEILASYRAGWLGHCTNTPALITASPLPPGVVGQAYTGAVAAMLGTPPYAFTVSQGTLPNGLNLSPAGLLTGTPLAAGNFTFTVRATDTLNAFGEREYALAVTGPPLGTNFVWTGAVDQDWWKPGNWVPTGVPGANDDASVNGGSPNWSEDVRVRKLHFRNGTIGGSGTFHGTMDWTNGNLTASFILPSGSRLNIMGDANRQWQGSVVNHGLVAWEGDASVYFGCYFYNEADGVLDIRGGGTASAYNTGMYNYGLIVKSAGSGTASLGPWENGFGLRNTGTVRAESGVLQLVGTGHIFSGPTNLVSADSGASVVFAGDAAFTNTTFAGPGLKLLTSSVRFAGTIRATNLTYSGGGSGQFVSYDSQPMTLEGTLDWASGNMYGIALTVPAGSRLNIIGTDGRLWSGCSINNSGLVVWDGPVNLNFGDSRFYNLPGGVWDIRGDAQISGYNAGIFNDGLITKSAGTGTTTFGSWSGHGLQNSATLRIETGRVWIQGGAISGGGGIFSGPANRVETATGASVVFAVGNAFQDTTFTGPGATLITNSAYFGGSIRATNLSYSGSSSGSFVNYNGQPVTLVGTLDWGSGGMEQTTLSVPAGSRLNLVGLEARRWSGCSINNSGLVVWDGPVNLNFDDSRFYNLPGGVWDIRGDAQISGYNAGVHNAGLITKTAGTGTTTLGGFTGPGFQNDGLLEIQRGVVSVSGEYTPGASSSLKFGLGGATPGTGFGRLTVTGAATLAGQIAAVQTGGFIPNVSDEFVVLTCTSRSGAFVNTNVNTGQGVTLFADHRPASVALVVQTVTDPPCAAVTNGLLAWWRGENNALDFAHTNHGALQGGAAFEPGRAGLAFSLDGTNDYVSVPAAASLSVTGFSITIQGWINPLVVDANGSHTILSKANIRDSHAFWYLAIEQGRLRFYISRNGIASGARSVEAAPDLVPVGVWSHVAATYDRGSRAMRLFINGEAVPTTSLVSNLIVNLPESPEPVRLGALVGSAGAPTDFFAGLLDEVMIFDRALTAGEVLATYMAGTNGGCIAAPTLLAPNPLPAGQVGGGYAFQFSGEQGVPPYSYVVTSGTLPPGLNLEPHGLLSGLPLAAGTWPFEVELTDAWGQSGPAARRAVSLTVTSAPIACLPRPAGLLGWWTGNGHPADFGGTNHGTLANEATFGNGVAGSAFLFDGTNDYVQVGPAAGLKLTNNQVTMAAWIYPTGPGNPTNGGTVLIREGEYGLIYRANRRLYVAVANTSPGWGGSPESPELPYHQWTHVAAVYDGTTVRTYFNGALVQWWYASGPIGDFRSTLNDFRIGGRQAFVAHFQGLIDEALVFNRALSEAEVDAIVHAGVAGLCQPLQITPASATVTNGATLAFSAAGGVPPYSFTLVTNNSGGGVTLAGSFAAGAGCGPDAVRLSDSAGSSVLAFVTVVDSLPPQFAPATNIVVDAPSPSGAVVSYQVTATDNCTATPVIFCVPPSGSVFPVGTNVVTCWATDLAGNQSTASFTVTVQPALSIFVHLPLSQQVKAGETLWLFTELRWPALVQWFFNGAEIPGATNAILQVPTFSAAQAGAYRVRATWADGAAFSPDASVQVEVPTAAITGPTLGTGSVKPRGDGSVQLAFQTKPGAIYTIERASALGGPGTRPFSPIMTVVATTTETKLKDTTASQHDAAFYRLVERTLPPPAPFSLSDATRFVGITEDGQTRPGLLPYQNTNTGQLGPMELQVAGRELPSGYGLRVRFPQGASPQVVSNATVLVARDIELYFGPDSPVQFADAPGGVVTIQSATDKQVPARSLTVGDLEAVMGRPANSGVNLVIYERFRVTLLQGTFEGSSIRGPVLTWAGQPGDALRLPQRVGPIGGYADADIDLTASRLRMAFYGEFRLDDGTPFAGVLRVAKSRPMWVELRPGGQISVGGAAEATFAGGPRLNVEFTLDDPSYNFRIKAANLRLPGRSSLAEMLPPLPALPAKENPDNFDAVATQLKRADQVTLAVAAQTATADAQANPGFPPDYRFGEDDLDELGFWTGWMMLDNKPVVRPDERDHLIRILERNAWGSWPPSDFIVPANVVENIVKIAIASKGGPDDHYIADLLEFALTRITELFELEPNFGMDSPLFTIHVRDLLDSIRDAKNAQIITEGQHGRLWNALDLALRWKIDSLADTLAVRKGHFRPEPGVGVGKLGRREAREYLEQVLAWAAISQDHGMNLLSIEGPNTSFLPELMAHLAFHLGDGLTQRMEQAISQCDERTQRHLLGENAILLEACKWETGSTMFLIFCQPDVVSESQVRRWIEAMEVSCDFNPLAKQGERSADLLADLDPLKMSLDRVHMDVPSATLQRQTAELAARLNSIFSRLLGGEQFPTSDLLNLLKAGLLYDELRLRFGLEGGTTWFAERMPDLRRRLQERAEAERNPTILDEMNKIFHDSMISYKDHGLVGGGSNGPALKSSAETTTLTLDDRRFHVLTAIHQNSAALRAMSVNAATVSADDPAAQADIWLPADITVEEAVGELHYNARDRRLGGSFSGRVSMPGVGRLDIRNASLNSGGAFDVSLSGRLAVPPGDAAPMAWVSIPVDRPWHFQLTEDRQLTIEGGARLELPNGARLECWASMSDPVYRFGAVAQGLRLSAANTLRTPVTTITLGQLTEAQHRDALELLAGVGDAMQPNDPANTFEAGLEPGAPFRLTVLPNGDTSGSAAYRGLALALQEPSLFPSAPQAAGGAPKNGGTSTTVVSNLLDVALAAAERSKRSFADQAATLTPPAGGNPTTGAEADDYRRRLFEVAKSLAEDGAEMSALTNAARRAADANLAGGNAALDLKAAAATMLAQYAACLEGTLTGLLITTTPGQPGPYWTDETARHCRRAFLILQQTEQMLEMTPVPSAELQPMLCGVTDVLVGRLFEVNGLNAATGLPDSPARRAIFDALVQAYTRGQVTNLLVEWRRQEQMGHPCGSPEFRTAAAALLTHQRAMVVAEFRSLGTAIFTRPWEWPERELELGREMFGILAALQGLGFNEYPVSTPGFVNPAQSGTMEDDAEQLALKVTAAVQTLLALTGDPASGYGPVLNGRWLTERGASLPEPSDFRSFITRFQNIAAVQTLRTTLAQLVRAEAQRLSEGVASRTPLQQVRRELLTVFSRALKLMGLLDTQNAGGAGAAGWAGNGVPKANEDLLGDFQNVIFPGLNLELEESQQPWWVSAEAARLCLNQRDASAGLASSAHQQALNKGIEDSYEVTRTRVAALSERVGALDSFTDLPLPGEIDIVRLYGEFLLNRRVPSFEARLGGRMEFPGVRLANGRPAFFDLRRFLFATDGRMELIAEAGAPLPFEGASFIGSVTNKVRLWPAGARAFEFHGGGTLFVNGNNYTAGLRYGPIEHDANGQGRGWRFDMDAGAGGFSNSFGNDFALFAASVGFSVGQEADGSPLAAVRTGGSAGLFRKPGNTDNPPGPEDFELSIRDVVVEIGGAGFPNPGAYAEIRRGTLFLPAERFGSAQLDGDVACPGVTVQTNSGRGPRLEIAQPIRLSYRNGNGLPELDGVIQFRDLGFHLPGIEQAQISICDARLGMGANGRPFFDVKYGRMKLPYPDALSDTDAVLKLENAHFGFDGLPNGTLSLAQNWDLIDTGGFKVTLLKGAPTNAFPPTSTNGQPVNLSACQGTYFRVESGPTFELGGAVQVTLPEVMVTDEQGAQVSGAVCGRLRIIPGPTLDSPPDVQLVVDAFRLAGTMKLGGGFNINGASVELGNLQYLANPSPAHAPYVQLGGTLVVGGFAAGMDGARAELRERRTPPQLSLAALRFGHDPATLPAPLKFLPFSLDFAEMRFKAPTAELPMRFAPSNVVLTVSGRVGLPTVAEPFLKGALSGVRFEFETDGTPIPPPIDGFDLQMVVPPEFNVPGMGDLAGKIHIGGLLAAFEAATPEQAASRIYMVGELGGTVQGYRVRQLWASLLAGPLGMCSDLNLANSGLVLSPTPFVITGGRGGLAMMTTDNPCDFTKYFTFDPVTGTYRLASGKDLPSVPGTPWPLFMSGLDMVRQKLAGLAAHMPTPPLPNLPGPNLAGGPQPKAGNEAVNFDCPSNCPPRTYTLLCQPHPTVPGRSIVKFTAIDEGTLNTLGITPALFQNFAYSAQDAALVFATAMVARVETLFPNPAAPGSGAPLPEGVGAFLSDVRATALVGLSNMVLLTVTNALGSNSATTFYTNLVALAGAGMPCLEATLMVEGRMSVLPVASFGWVAGRYVAGLGFGDVGLVGELNLLGIPVGEIRGFLSPFDDQGLPNPSLCGEAHVAIGPLELGRVNVAAECRNCVTEPLRLFPALALALGDTLTRDFMGRIAPQLVADAPNAAATVQRVLAIQDSQERARTMLAFVGSVLAAGPSVLPPNLGEVILNELRTAADNIQPRLVMCGRVQPKLFGLPLTLNGRPPVELLYSLTKTNYGLSFSISPSAFNSVFPPGDQFTFQEVLPVPDPVTLLLDSLSGDLNSPDTAAAYVRRQMDHALAHSVFSMEGRLQPLGLKLGVFGSRVVLPDLTDHPVLRRGGWTPPEDRTPALPSRDEVLVAAAVNGKLGLAASWIGTTNDFMTVFPEGDPRRAVLEAQRLELRHDYFPHGGVLGGGQLEMPRILTRFPSYWLSDLHHIRTNGNLFAQFGDAVKFVEDWLLTTETNGSLAFYLPAPNPPIFYDGSGQPLGKAQLNALQARGFQPEDLLASIRAFDLSSIRTGKIYPAEQAFLRGDLTNTAFLGIPFIDGLTIRGVPIPGSVPAGEPLATIEFVATREKTWLGKLANRDLSVRLTVDSPPELSIEKFFTDLTNALITARDQLPLAGGPAPKAATPPPELVNFFNSLSRGLPRFSYTNDDLHVVLKDPLAWAVSDGGNHPPALDAGLKLYLFSPQFAPNTVGDGPVANAAREGGFAAEGSIKFLPESPLEFTANAKVAVLPTTGNPPNPPLPRLMGQLRNVNLPDAFPGLPRIQNATADFDTGNARFLVVSNSFDPINLGGLFSFQPVNGQPTLGAEAAAEIANKLPRLSLALDAARFSSPRFTSAGLVVHGYEGRASRWSLRTDGNFNAQVSFEASPALGGAKSLDATCQWTLRTPLPGNADFPVLCLKGLPQAAFKLNGSGLDNFTLSFNASVQTLQVKLFPELESIGLVDNPWIALTPPVGNANLSFFFKSDGTYELSGSFQALEIAGQSFTSGSFTLANRKAIFRGQIAGGTSANLTLTLNDDGTVGVEGGVTLLPAFCVADRICLSGADGVSGIGFSAGPDGLCASGVLLRLKGLRPGGGDVDFNLPQLCLNSDGTLPPLLLDPADLALGPFKLEGLSGLTVSGNPLARRLEVNATGRLRVGPVLDADFGLHLDGGGVLLSNRSPSQTLLGFQFSDVNCSLQALFASLGDSKLSFKGKLPSLPAPFPSVWVSGEIPATGPFALGPLSRTLRDIADLPGFPLKAIPAFEYKPGVYANIVRSHGPSGYWRMEENIPRTAGGLPPTPYFATLADSSVAGDAVGTYRPKVPTSGSTAPPLGRQPGAFDTNSNYAVFFDGVDDRALIPMPAGNPARFNNTNALTVELWFRRGTDSPYGGFPQRLAGHGTEWGLGLESVQSGSFPVFFNTARLAFMVDRLRDPNTSGGGFLSPLVSNAAFDDTNWHHAIAVFDGAVQLLYVDGQLDSWRAVKGAPRPSSQPIGLGATITIADGESETVSEHFHGWLDEVAVYDQALSPAVVLDHWLAAGHGGVRLTGKFDFPGLNLGSQPPSFGGFIGQDGSRALQIDSGQPDPLGLASTFGIKFPETRVALFSVPGQVIATLDGSLDWPQLFADKPKIKGFFSSAHGGELNIRATDLGTPRLRGFRDFRFTDFSLTKRGAQNPQANFNGSLGFPLNAGTVNFAGDFNGSQFSLTNSSDTTLCAGPGCFEFNQGALGFTFGAQGAAVNAAGRYRVGDKDPLTAHLAWSANGNAALGLSVDTGWISPQVRYWSVVENKWKTTAFPGSARATGGVAFQVSGTRWALSLDGTFEATLLELPRLSAGFQFDLESNGAFGVDQSLGGYSGFQFDLW